MSQQPPGAAGAAHPPPPGAPVDFAERRRSMAMKQLAERGIHDTRVLSAMGRLPRERFVPARRAAPGL